MSFAVFCILACGEPSDPGSAETAETSDTGWTVGPVEDCDSPTSVGWTDASDLLSGDGVEVGSTINGPITVGVIEGRTWIAALVGDADLAWWTLDGELGGTHTYTTSPVRVGLQDIDGDGVLDLWTNGEAVEIAWSFGTAAESWETVTARDAFCLGLQELTVFDADGDGDLDLLYSTGLGCVDDDGAARPLLVRNTGERRFGAPERIEGPASAWGATFEAAVADLDGDLDPDVYLCNDFGPETAPNAVLFNDGTGRFTLGDDEGLGITTYCMSASVADLDGDGVLDMFVGAATGQFALVRTRAGYVDEAAAWGLRTFDGVQMPWGTAAVDADNDGLVGVVMTTSDFNVPAPEWFPILVDHPVTPSEWVVESEAWGLPQSTGSRAVLARDLNRDGVVDLVAADFRNSPWLLVSDGCTAQSWVEVSAPPGTVVRVEAGGQAWTALATDDPGFAATGPSLAHIGLGQEPTIDRVVATVPWVGERVLVGPFAARRRIEWAPG